MIIPGNPYSTASGWETLAQGLPAVGQTWADFLTARKKRQEQNRTLPNPYAALGWNQMPFVMAKDLPLVQTAAEVQAATRAEAAKAQEAKFENEIAVGNLTGEYGGKPTRAGVQTQALTDYYKSQTANREEQNRIDLINSGHLDPADIRPGEPGGHIRTAAEFLDWYKAKTAAGTKPRGTGPGNLRDLTPGEQRTVAGAANMIRAGVPDDQVSAYINGNKLNYGFKSEAGDLLVQAKGILKKMPGGKKPSVGVKPDLSNPYGTAGTSQVPWTTNSPTYFAP